MGLILGIVLSVGGVALAQFGACNAVNELLDRKNEQRRLASEGRVAEFKMKNELMIQKLLKEANISD